MYPSAFSEVSSAKSRKPSSGAVGGGVEREAAVERLAPDSPRREPVDVARERSFDEVHHECNAMPLAFGDGAVVAAGRSERAPAGR
jgi:hypothetical protein